MNNWRILLGDVREQLATLPDGCVRTCVTSPPYWGRVIGEMAGGFRCFPCDEVIAKLAHRMKSLRVGDPLDKNTDVGAINSKSQLSTITPYLDSGVAEGAKLHEVNGSPLPNKGYWCRPCFFTGVQPSHRIAREDQDPHLAEVLVAAGVVAVPVSVDDVLDVAAAGEHSHKGCAWRSPCCRLRAFAEISKERHIRLAAMSPLGS